MSWSPDYRNELDDAIDDWMTNSSGTPYHAVYGQINNWDVSNIEDMGDLFKDRSDVGKACTRSFAKILNSR